MCNACALSDATQAEAASGALIPGLPPGVTGQAQPVYAQQPPPPQYHQPPPPGGVAPPGQYATPPPPGGAIAPGMAQPGGAPASPGAPAAPAPAPAGQTSSGPRVYSKASQRSDGMGRYADGFHSSSSDPALAAKCVTVWRSRPSRVRAHDVKHTQHQAHLRARAWRAAGAHLNE